MTEPPTPSPGAREELSVAELHARTRIPLRTLKRYVARWCVTKAVPVRREKREGDTRWRYWVDCAAAMKRLGLSTP